VLGADVVVAHPARFLNGELEHLLDARSREDVLLDGDPLVAPELGLDRLADLDEVDAQVVENFGGQPITFAEQSQEHMLRTDVAMVRPFCFFLGERQNLLGSLSEPLERVHVL
jgi:hypothetical protein